MATLIVREPVHYKVKLRATTHKQQIQTVVDFLLRSALDLEINDAIMEELHKIAGVENVGLEEVLTFLCAHWRVQHGNKH